MSAKKDGHVNLGPISGKPEYGSNNCFDYAKGRFCKDWEMPDRSDVQKSGDCGLEIPLGDDYGKTPGW